MEDDVQLIKDIMPSLPTPQIEKVLRETGDLGVAVKLLLNPGSPVIHRNRTQKRVIISVNSDFDEAVISAVKAAVTSVRSCEVVVSDIAPQYTISVSFQSRPCKPMIYIEPDPLDAPFLANIEEKSLIVTEKYDEMEIKVLASFYGIVLLPPGKDTIMCSVKRVLIENAIIGEGFGVRRYGDLWCEMLREIPSVNAVYAEAIAEQVPSPYQLVTTPPGAITTKAGNKMPQRTIDTIRLLYTTDDPSTPLDTRNARAKQ